MVLYRQYKKFSSDLAMADVISIYNSDMVFKNTVSTFLRSLLIFRATPEFLELMDFLATKSKTTAVCGRKYGDQGIKKYQLLTKLLNN